jgi:hypothetical protein
MVKQTIAAVRNNNGFIIDDLSPCDVAYKPDHLAVMLDEEANEIVVPIFKQQLFPLTKIELDHAGRPHMTRNRLNKIFDTRHIEAHDISSVEPEVILVIDI